MAQDDNGLEVARITITRVLTDDGDQHHVEVSPNDLALIEALGMLRLAEDSLIQFPPSEQEGEH